MSAPAVSVIMNCLNSARDLRAALGSLMAQTFGDFEVIFWDNGSTDDSPAIAQSYGPKLRYFRGKTTVPLGAARNLALMRARGRYLAFLDCDDLWRPRKLETQVALFEADPRVALAGLAADPGAWDGGWFDESLNVCEEADVFYRIAHDWELDFVDEPLTLWRVHGANTTFRKFGQFADETLRILDKHRRLYPGYDAEHADLAALLTRRAAFQKAVALWREGRNAEARACIAPWRDSSRKHRLFWWASFLPGSLFDLAARAYFALPSGLRR